MNPGQMWNKLRNKAFDKFSTNQSGMLIWTAAIGWMLSSAAQIGAIVANDKIDRDEKEFLVPQEIADAIVNILLFIGITTSLSRFAGKLVSTGKLTNTKILNALKEPSALRELEAKKLNIELGKFSTNLGEIEAIRHVYKPFENAVKSIASLPGMIISSNIITPIIRNRAAFELNEMNKNQKPVLMARPRMVDFQKNSILQFSSRMRV